MRGGGDCTHSGAEETSTRPIMWTYLNEDLEPVTCSQEREGEFLPTYFLTISQLLPLKSKNTHEKCSCSGSETEFCQDSQSGTTSEHSTASHGADSLMWSQEDFRVRIFHPLDVAWASRGGDQDYGSSKRESLAKYCRHSHSWKTHQGLLFSEQLESLEIWPNWATWDEVACWEDSPLVPASMESVCGLSLLRPIKTDGLRHKYKVQNLIRKNHADGNLPEQLARLYQKMHTPETLEILMRWPIGWTDLAPLETDKIHSWRLLHGGF